MDVAALTKLEQDIVAQVRAARAYILAPSAPQSPSPAAQVRADVLREFVLGGLTETVNSVERVVRPGVIGLQVRGVWIDGDLDLADAEREGMPLPALVLESCLIPGVIQLANAHLSRLSLAGSRIVALEASGLRVEGDVDLSGVSSAEEAADATGARFDGARVPRCQVRLSGARVGGELRAAGARLAAAPNDDLDAYALDCANLTVAHDIMAQPGLIALGGVRLRGARLGGQVWLEGAQLRGQGQGRALHGYGVEIRGQLYGPGLETHGSLNLSGARIEGELFMPKCRLHGGVDFTGARVAGKINMSGSQIANGVMGPGAHFGGDLELGAATITADSDGDCIYMSGVTLAGSLQLAGAVLARATPPAPTPAADADAPAPAPQPTAQRFALYAANAVFRQNVELSLNESYGVVDFSGATIGGTLTLRCAALSTQYRDVVAAADIDVERSVYVVGNYNGALAFERARIRGEFRIDALSLTAAARRVPQLSLRDARINGVLQVSPRAAMVRTDALDDFETIVGARVTPAPFYPGWSVVDVRCRRNGEEAARALLWDGADDVVLLDNNSRTLHDFNDGNLGRSGGGRSRLRLKTDKEAEAYLKFFCGVIQGDAGAFRIVSSVRGRDANNVVRTFRERPAAKVWSPEELAKLAAKRKPDEDPPPPITASALVSYEGAIFRAKFGIQRAGGVEMIDDDPIAHHLDPPKIDYKTSPGWRTIREAGGQPGTLKGLPPLYESNWRDLRQDDLRRIEKAWRFYIAPKVDLSGLDLAAFEDGDGENWGDAFTFELEGVAFQRFAAEVRAAAEKSGLPPGSSGAAGAREEALELSPDSAEARLRWLARQARTGEGWSPQPHEMFAQVYRRHGHMSDSIRILTDKAERDLMKQFPRLWRPRFFWRGVREGYREFMKLFWGGGFQYGLSPLRALGTCIIFLAIGWLGVEAANNGRPAPYLNFDDGGDRSALVIDSTPVQGVAFARGGDIALGVQPTDQTPVSDVPCGSAITPWIYAADVFIPLLDLRQESACSVRGDPWAAPWRWLKALYAALGWVVISLSILTWSGALRRQTGA